MQNKVPGTAVIDAPLLETLITLDLKAGLPARHKNLTDRCSSLIFHRFGKHNESFGKGGCDARHTLIRAVNPSIAACAGVEAYENQN
jgi:hypothetical protein